MFWIVKRAFDIVVSAFGLLILSPVLLLLSLGIVLESRGGVFYRQVRVGKNQKPFKILKLRSMRVNSDSKGLLTVGKDNRITKMGAFIRKFKLDEFPQLFNVLVGEMSLVGPRPEVPKYVAHYTEDQLRVFQMRPGITDYASIKYRNENELLSQSDEPEKTYLEEVLPDKLKINLEYVDNPGFFKDLKIIFTTLTKLGV